MTNYFPKLPFDFSLREAKDRGVFISGMPRSGKTNLAKMLADYLLKLGFIIKVFDPSLAWMESSLPYFVRIDEEWWRQLNKLNSIPINQSIVYDMGGLYPNTQKQFVGHVLNSDFKFNYYNMDKVDFTILYFLEECQMIIPSGSLRSNYAQATFRMISVGRNYKQRMVLLSQRPNDVSTKALSRVGLMYVGGHYESNDIKKISNFFNRIPKETYEMLSGLKIGQFMFLNPYEKILKKINTPLFETDITPKDYFDRPQPKKRGFWSKLLG